MIYRGFRTSSGDWTIKIFQNEQDTRGRKLRHISIHSPSGYSWGYDGSGPSDAAIAILAHHFGENAGIVKRYWNRHFGQPVRVSRAILWHIPFRAATVANWSMRDNPSDDSRVGGEVTTEQIDAILAELRQEYPEIAEEENQPV